MTMKKGDIVLVETFAGVDVHVVLKEHCSYPTQQKQVAYAGWQIINNIKYLDDALDECGNKCLSEYEEEVELYKTYGGD